MNKNRIRKRRDSSEVSPLIKYLLFGFNVIFWLVGFIIFGIGIYAWIEKDTFTRLLKSGIAMFDPAFIFLIVGAGVFVIGFCGCIGALRENTFLLLLFSFALGIIFFAELAIGILAYFYNDKFRTEIKIKLKDAVKRYREDDDLQDLIDWFQRGLLHCCGITGPDDWNDNQYFECSKNWIESCGVPSSCCKSSYANNRQCGFGVRNKTISMADNTIFKIYSDGCLKKGEEWLSYHILPVSIVVVGLAVLQILGVCFAQNLRNDINLQKAKWLYRGHR